MIKQQQHPTPAPSSAPPVTPTPRATITPTVQTGKKPKHRERNLSRARWDLNPGSAAVTFGHRRFSTSFLANRWLQGSFSTTYCPLVLPKTTFTKAAAAAALDRTVGREAGSDSASAECFASWHKICVRPGGRMVRRVVLTLLLTFDRMMLVCANIIAAQPSPLRAFVSEAVASHSLWGPRY